MKRVGEREMQKKTTPPPTQQQKRQKRARGTEATEKGRELYNFIVHLSRFSPVHM